MSFNDPRKLYVWNSISGDILLGPRDIPISDCGSAVKMIRNLIQSQLGFLEFEDRTFIENENCFYNVKVESVSFHVVPVAASNSK